MLNISNSLETLNGWKRAWVLCSIIWLVVIIVSSFSSFPTKGEQIAAMEKFDFELFPPRTYDTNSCFDNNANPLDMNSLEQSGKCLEGIRAIRDNEFQSRMERNNSALKSIEEQIINQQASFLGKKFMFWLLPMIALYVSGLMVSWVIRGFKDDRH